MHQSSAPSAPSNNTVNRPYQRHRAPARHRSGHVPGLILPLVVLCPLLLLGCQDHAPERAQAADPARRQPTAAATKKVLLVHSYHTGYPWVDAITQGVKRALSGSPVELQTYYMDTKRKTGTEWKTEAGKTAKNIVTEWQPDVVIAADDNAQQYFAREFAGAGRPQVVFCGVNAEPEDYGYPAANVTGILERPHFQASLDLLREICPRAKRIAIVTDDSPTSAGALHHMTPESGDYEIVCRETPTTFPAWQAVITRCQDTADAIAVYMYHTVKREGEDQSMPPKEVMDWTVANSRIPIVGFFIFTVDDGALCGLAESGVEHGFRAGQITLDLLHGKTAVDVPIVTALDGQSMLNLRTAKRLGISIPRALVELTDIVIEE